MLVVLFVVMFFLLVMFRAMVAIMAMAVAVLVMVVALVLVISCHISVLQVRRRPGANTPSSRPKSGAGAGLAQGGKRKLLTAFVH